MKAVSTTVQMFPLRGLPKTMQVAMTLHLKEAAKVWNFCKNLHYQVRKQNQEWPDNYDVMKVAKEQNFKLHSQTVQQIITAFFANVKTIQKLRRDDPRHHYPNKDKEIFPVYWPKQAVHKKQDRVTLPMGRGRKSLVFNIELLKNSGAVKLLYKDGWYLHVCVERPIKVNKGVNQATIDLGQIHHGVVVVNDVKNNLTKAVIVSGRKLRSNKSRNDKMLKQTRQLLKSCKKGSSRYRNIKRSQNQQSARNERRNRDLRHNGVNKMIGFLKDNKVKEVFVGNPVGVRYKNSGKRQNQRMNLWEVGKDLNYLQYKCKTENIECFTGEERGTSSMCPVCGCKHKVSGRNWNCPQCDFKGHRDVVGAVNMFPLAYHKQIIFPRMENISYLQPMRIGSSNRADTPQTPCGANSTRNMLSRSLGKVEIKVTAKLAEAPVGLTESDKRSSGFLEACIL